MNYYIDFDNTLYNTTILNEKMCNIIAQEISLKTNKEIDEYYNEVLSNFNREHIYNIYILCEHFAKKYDLKNAELIQKINLVILNGKENLYDDSTFFLKNLKQKNHTINILTYVTQDNLSYQLLKLNGSTINSYVDNIIVSSINKFDLDLKYNEGIFIDDNPDILIGLHSKNPYKLIRIKRPNNKYSSIDININIPEYTTLEDIII